MANSNSATSSRYLSVSNGHIDGLINYVLDVKPYHTKLSEVVEEFLFEDTIGVKMTESIQSMVVLGPDYLNRSGNIARKVWSLQGASRPIDWLSAERTTVSDGTRRTYPVPTTVISKLSSQVGLDKFVAGTHDDYQIPGIQKGVFNQKRWSGAGVAAATVNGQPQCESVDFHLSYGAFSFNTQVANGKVSWKEAAVGNNQNFTTNPGELVYDSVYKSYGTIVDIQSTAYEEWTLTWNGTTLNVVGSTSGKIGEAQYKQKFTSPKLSFMFTSAVGDDSEMSAVINFGDQFVLSPRNKITIAPTAPAETWTIIKTNPQAIAAKPIFKRVGAQPTTSPAIAIFTKDLEWCPASDWTLTFTSPTSYTITVIDSKKNPVAGYPKTVSLADGLGYSDANIHFSLTPPSGGFKPGDTFTFTVKEKKENYLVFGSVSGWQKSAVIGEWYWNGKIGFKIPKLDYFAFKRSTAISTSLNGLDWVPAVINRQEMLNVNYINNSFIAAGVASIIGQSINGQSWNDDLTSFITIDKRLIVIGSEGFIAETEDGKTWYRVASNVTANLNGIDVAPTSHATSAASENVITIVGDRGVILTSLNGIGWKLRNSGVPSALNGVAHNDDWIVAVGDNGTILKSNDRINWTQVAINFDQNINKIKYINGAFWIVGARGLIAKSTNVNTWTIMDSGLTAELDDIAFGNDLYVAVGKNGYTCISEDLGLTWTSFSGNPINSIEYGAEDGVFVCVHKKVNQVVDFTPLRPIHSVAVPSVYSIVLRDPVQASTSASHLIKGGTVTNNVYGNRPGIIIDKPWNDDISSFIVGSATGVFSPGEEISIYLAPRGKYSANGDYDDLPYEFAYYDTHVGEIEYPVDLLQEYFPLVHSHGSVIFSANFVNGTKITIDKASNDTIKMRVSYGSDQIPSALATERGWLPLEMRYYDKRYENGSLSPAVFPNSPTIIEAYMAADPDVKVFTVEQPLYEANGLPASATLTFDKPFFDKFLTEKTQFSLRFDQADSFGQRIRVKVSENLRMYSRVRLIFDDIMVVKVKSDQIGTFETATFIKAHDLMLIKAAEGGVFSYLGYDELPYDTIGYGMNVETNIVSGLIENPPGSGNYVYTGNPSDYVVLSNGAAYPAMKIKDSSADAPKTKFAEGLQIATKHTSDNSIISLNVNYDTATDTAKGGVAISLTATNYVVTHNYVGGTPTIIIKPNSGGNFTAVPTDVHAVNGAGGLGSLTFSVPNGTGPFKFTLT